MRLGNVIIKRKIGLNLVTNLISRNEFVDELGREFIGERHRRIDLIRWNRFSEGAWWDKTPDATNQDVFPIPYRALNANPLLKQTTAGF